MYNLLGIVREIRYPVSEGIGPGAFFVSWNMDVILVSVAGLAVAAICVGLWCLFVWIVERIWGKGPWAT